MTELEKNVAELEAALVEEKDANSCQAEEIALLEGRMQTLQA